jgi:hypothetical protein
MPSPCERLQAPYLVKAQKIVLLDSQGNPMRDACLEFREYTKGQGKFVASLKTDSNGVADVFSLSGVGGLVMSVLSEPASGGLIQFTKDAPPGQQMVKLFHWRCRGQVMQGAMVLA